VVLAFNRLQMVIREGEVVPPKQYPVTDVDAMVVEQDILKIMGEYPGFNGVGGFATYAMTGSDLHRCYNQGVIYPNTYDYAKKLGTHMGKDDFEGLISWRDPKSSGTIF